MNSAFMQALTGVGGTLYIQIWQRRLKVTASSGSVVFDEPPMIAVDTQSNGKEKLAGIGNAAIGSAGASSRLVAPFTHPRTLLMDFVYAEQLLIAVYAKAAAGKLIRPSPRVIIHPMEKTEGGLTMIERRALFEMAEGAGAASIIIHEGPELTLVEGTFVGHQNDVDAQKILNSGNSRIYFKRIKVFLLVMGILIWVAFKMSGLGQTK